MATQSGAIVASPSSGSLGSNMTNGQPASDFEVISRQPSSNSFHNGHGSPSDLMHVSPLMANSVTSTLPSMTDFTLNQAIQRIQELSKDNQELRDFLRNNADVMKKQFQTLVEYKEKVQNANAYHREKFEQTKMLVLSLRDERGKLHEECEGLKSRLADLECSNKALTQHKTIGDKTQDNLQKEVETLQQKLAIEISEKTDLIMVSKDDLPADEETAKLVEKVEYLNMETTALREENSRLMKDVRQFKCTADQILCDLESTQRLKSDRDTECKILGKENARLSEELQQALKEVRKQREKNDSLTTQVHGLQSYVGLQTVKIGNDASFVNVVPLSSGIVSSDLPKATAVTQPLSTAWNQISDPMISSKTKSEEESPECDSLTLNSNAMADMFSQIQTERDSVADLRAALAEKNEQIQKLQKDLSSKEELLLSKRTRIESSAEEVTTEQAKVISDIKATTDKLGGNGTKQMNSQEDIISLKSQVLTLIDEVHESQTKLRAATDALDQKTKRLLQLESQNGDLNMQLERQRAQDDALIDSMRLNLTNVEQALGAERIEHQNTRKQLATLRGSFNDLVKDYKDLLDTFEEHRVSTKKKEEELQSHVHPNEEISTMTAQLIGAEEAIAFRDTQIKELKQDLHKAKQELEKIPVLKAQADVYKSDFDAERKAREKQHDEKETILREMNNLQTQNQQLLDELESFSRNQIVEMQQKHAHGNFWQKPKSKHTYTLVPPPAESNPQTPTRYPYPGPQEGDRGAQATPHPQDDAFDYTQLDEIYGCHHCPKCGQQHPDLDSLQLHVIECLDNDTPQDTFRM